VERVSLICIMRTEHINEVGETVGADAGGESKEKND